MTKPLQQLRITQLMGRGAQTLIVPDTNTAASLLCISILCISVSAEANWVMGALGLLSELTQSASWHTDSALLTHLGCSHPDESRPSLFRLSASRCCAAARCQPGDVPLVSRPGCGSVPGALPGGEGRGGSGAPRAAAPAGMAPAPSGGRPGQRGPAGAGTGGVRSGGFPWKLRPQCCASLLMQLWCWETR